MSSTLYWKPILPIAATALPYELKKVISPRYFQHDGSLGGSGAVLEMKDLEYIRGLIDGGVKGAQELYDAIEQHGAIELYFEV